MAHERRKFVSLFSGCGGLDLGFSNSGFQCIGAFDLDSEALNTHRRNLGAPAHQLDLSTQCLPTELRPDVVIAGTLAKVSPRLENVT